jgi:hypothetical protein
MLDQYRTGESVFYFDYTTTFEVRIHSISTDLLFFFNGFCTGELSPMMAAALQLTGPMLDQYLTRESVFYFDYTTTVEVRIHSIWIDLLFFFDGFCMEELRPHRGCGPSVDGPVARSVFDRGERLLLRLHHHCRGTNPAGFSDFCFCICKYVPYERFESHHGCSALVEGFDA